jgi:hypothetical protein
MFTNSLCMGVLFQQICFFNQCFGHFRRFSAKITLETRLQCYLSRHLRFHLTFFTTITLAPETACQGCKMVYFQTKNPNLGKNRNA